MYYDENNNYFEYNKYNSEINKDYMNFDSSKNYDVYNEIKFDNAHINIGGFRENDNLYSPSEGLNHGNMFKNLYDQYKNYKYRVVVKGKREELLLKIQELAFATKDINLYLDLYPNDTKMLDLYKLYNSELKKYEELYNKEYTALTSDSISKNYFDWVSNPWPWENKGGNHYV